MKKIITLILAVLTALTCFSFIGCGNNGKLKVGYTDYAPMNYFLEDGTFVGFDTELAKEVGKILNYEIEFIEINWDNKVMALESKEIDVVWNGMTITEELKAAMSITEAYLENKQVVVCKVADASKFTSVDSLKTVTASKIIVEGGSAGEAVLTENEITGYLTADAQKDTLVEIKTSASDIAIIDLTMAKVLVGEGTANTDLTYVDIGLETEEFGIGLRKTDTELTKKINDAIKTLKDNGKFAELAAKYFG